MKVRYKDPSLQEHYDLMLKHARAGKFYTEDGRQWRGASHRASFWNGFNGLRNQLCSRGTFNYVSFYAGRQFAKEQRAKR